MLLHNLQCTGQPSKTNNYSAENIHSAEAETLMFSIEKPHPGTSWASQVVNVVKNTPANARDVRDMGLIPGSGGSPGAGHSNLLQCSCLENSMDRGAWWATVHGVTKSWTRLKWLNTHARTLGPPTFCVMMDKPSRLGAAFCFLICKIRCSVWFDDLNGPS